MTNTKFVDGATTITASWLNDINRTTYVDQINVKDFGAVGDGIADDTGAIQAAFDYSIANKRTSVFLPSGIYLVGKLFFGTQNLLSQSESPIRLFGDGWSTTLRAKSNVSGTLLQAWSLAGVTFENFEIDCNHSAAVGIDSEWKGGPGPSCQNRYQYIRIYNFINTGWNAINNNDCIFEQVVVIGDNHSQTGIDITASGGLTWIQNCIWTNCLLKFGSQNGKITTSWGMGIQFSDGCLNYVYIDSCYIYGNTSLQACLHRPDVLYQSVGAFVSTATQYIGDGVSSFLDCKFGSRAEFSGCQFISSHTLNMFGPNSVSGNSERPVVHFKGGSFDSSKTTLNSKDSLLVHYESFIDERTGFFAFNSSEKTTHFYTASTTIIANNWYNIVDPGKLAPGMYAVEFRWDHKGSGSPYMVNAASLIAIDVTNAPDAFGQVLTTNSSSHLLAGESISLRLKSGSAQTPGLQFSANLNLPAGGVWSCRFSKL